MAPPPPAVVEGQPLQARLPLDRRRRLAAADDERVPRATATRSGTSGARSCSTRRPTPDQDPRHLGTIEPLWTLLDLTPEGRRPDWDEQLATNPTHDRRGPDRSYPAIRYGDQERRADGRPPWGEAYRRRDLHLRGARDAARPSAALCPRRPSLWSRSNDAKDSLRKLSAGALLGHKVNVHLAGVHDDGRAGHR